LLDHQLYLPREWVEVVEPPEQGLTAEQRRDAERRLQRRHEEVRIPATVRFATKPELALRLIERCAVALDWVTADDLYGRNRAFLEGLEARHQLYVAEVPGFTRVWLEDPARCQGPQAGIRRPSRAVERRFVRRVDDLAKSLPPEAWALRTLREGAKGPLAFRFARVRVWATRVKKAGPPIWVVIQRSLEPTPKLRYWVSDAPEGVGLEVLTEVIGCRWRVEETLEDAKSHLGMADYEARGWTSWHHHMSLVALAHLYVTLTRLELRAEEPALTLDMAVRLLEASLPRPKLTEEDALELIAYHLHRNEVAHQSHRKTWLAKHPEAPD
jgi:SRSO17 transposase